VENGILLTLCVVGLSELVCVSRARVCVFFSSTFLHIPTPYVVRVVRAVVVVVVVVVVVAADEGTYIVTAIVDGPTCSRGCVEFVEGVRRLSFREAKKNETKRNNIMYIPPVHDAHNIKSHTHTHTLRLVVV